MLLLFQANKKMGGGKLEKPLDFPLFLMHL